MVERKISGPTRPGTDVSRFRATGFSGPRGTGGSISGPTRPGTDEEIFRRTGESVPKGSSAATRIRSELKAQDLKSRQQQQQASQERQASIQSRTIGGQLGGGGIQELGAPVFGPGESARDRSFFREGVSRTRGFLGGPSQIPFFRVPTGGVREVPTLGGAVIQSLSPSQKDADIVTRRTPFGIAGAIPITDITRDLEESKSPFVQGIGGGIEAVAATPGEIIKSTVPFAIGGGAFSLAGRGAAVGARALGLGKFVPAAGKATGAVLGGTFLVERGFALSKAETAAERGAFVSETGVGLGSFVGGGKAVSKFFPKPKVPSKPEDVVFLGAEQKGVGGGIETRLRFQTEGGRTGISESLTIPIARDAETSIFRTFTKGEILKTGIDFPTGRIRQRKDVGFEGILTGVSKTIKPEVQVPTGIEGVSRTKQLPDITLTLGAGRARATDIGLKPGEGVTEFKTGGLGVRLGDVTFGKGIVETKGGIGGFAGIVGETFGAPSVTGIPLRGRLPKAKTGTDGIVGPISRGEQDLGLKVALEQSQAFIAGALPPPPVSRAPSSKGGLGLVGIQKAVGGLGLTAPQIRQAQGPAFDITGGVTRGPGGSRQLVQELAPGFDIGGDIFGKVSPISRGPQVDFRIDTQFQPLAQQPKITEVFKVKTFVDTLPSSKQFQPSIQIQPQIPVLGQPSISKPPRQPPIVKEEFLTFAPGAPTRRGPVGFGFIPPAVVPSLGGFGAPPRPRRRGKKVKRRIAPSFTAQALELEFGLPEAGVFGISPFEIRGLQPRKKSKTKKKKNKK